jgi:aspartate/methionine/tyrosine aminotransferase
MRLPPYALDRWLHRHRQLPFQLAGSTGPAWTLGELLALAPEAPSLADLRLSYADGDGGAGVRAAIAAQYRGVDPDHVQVTVGAQEALLITFALAAEPGANVILPDPCYPGISELAVALGLEPRRYRLLRARRFALAAEDVEAQLDRRTRLVVVNTPHNPTGAVVEPDVLRRLADAARVVGARLLCDEVYHPLRCDGGVETPSSAEYLPEAIVLGDLSKALSLPGLRLGWIIDRDARQRERAFDAHAYFTITHSPLLEHLAEIALGRRATLLARARSVIAVNRARLTELVEAHEERLAWVPTAGGTTAFPWLQECDDARPFCEALARRGVVVGPGDCFGSAAHFRIGLGGDPGAFARGVDLLADELAGVQATA